MGSVPGNRTIVSLGEETSFLFSIALLGPELEAALEAEEVLIVCAVNVWQDTEGAARGRIGAHQGKGIVGGGAGDGKSVELGVDRHGMGVLIVREDIGARGGGGLGDVEVLNG